MTNSLFKRWQPPAIERSLGYQRWRRQFLLNRIPLACGLGIIFQLSFLVFDSLEPAMTLGRENYGNHPTGIQQWLPYGETSLSIILLLSLGWLRQQPAIKRSPHQLIILFSLFFVILPQLPDLLLLTPDTFTVNIVALMIAALMQAILLPVYWRSHLIAQGLLLSFLPLGFVWILTSQWQALHTAGAFTNGVLERNLAELFGVLSLQLIVSAIALVIVWQQERFLMRQFDLRDRRQLLLHAIAHDLRPTAIGIVLLLQQLRNPQGHVEISQEILQQMLESSDRQLQLIKALTVAHTNNIPLQRQPTRLPSLIQAVLKDMQPLVKQASATVTLAIPDNLPTVFVDPLQLHRVYENLIRNAIEYTPNSVSIVLSANIKSQSTQTWLHCSVHDNGPGLTPQQCDRLFERYSQSTSTRSPIHLGLGLHICHQIITAHSGQIGVQSEAGNGTLFWFTLPLS